LYCPFDGVSLYIYNNYIVLFCWPSSSSTQHITTLPSLLRRIDEALSKEKAFFSTHSAYSALST
jgi:hypothetical protein